MGRSTSKAAASIVQEIRSLNERIYLMISGYFGTLLLLLALSYFVFAIVAFQKKSLSNKQNIESAPKGRISISQHLFKLFNRLFPFQLPSTSRQRHTLKRQMTPIGRFALKSQTNANQSINTFFVRLAVPKGSSEMSLEEFEDLWRSRVMNRHERFKCRVLKEDDRFFEVIDMEFSQYACEVTHPSTREHFQQRIAKMLTSPLDANSRLWEAQISTGPLCSSMALSFDKLQEIDAISYDRESVILCRVHHALADGVSLGVVIADASDESLELRKKTVDEINRRKQMSLQRSPLDAMVLFLGKVNYFLFGSIRALSLQFWRMATSYNPFDLIMAESSIPSGHRTTAWRNVAPIAEVKKVSKSVSPASTVNDVFVSCVSAAITRQLQHSNEIQNRKNSSSISSGRKIPSSVSLVVPVHLHGGLLLPGRPLGNHIGAFVASVPTTIATRDNPASRRLGLVSSSLSKSKSTPSHLISWSIAKICSELLPENITKWAMQKANAHSVAVVSNVRGFPFQVHWNGRPVEQIAPFLPLPPGIPIGVVVQSYAGYMSFTINADKRAVPDANRFGEWMMEEYMKLKEEGAGCNKG